MVTNPPLRIWLITVGEPLPLPGARDRLLRTGLLAAILAGRGHEVVWWTSTVDHVRKQRFVEGEPSVVSVSGARLRFLDGYLYRGNVSLGRIRNHVQIGRRFAALAADESRPDVILCSFPTIELSREAVKLGRAVGAPVVLDVRDLWPDIFVGMLPRWLKALEQALLRGWFADTRSAFAGCAGVFAVSEGYLEWGLAKAGRARGSNDEVYPLAYQLAERTAADDQALTARLTAAGVAPDAALICFVGSFGRTYDLDTVIDAARRIAASGRVRPTFVLCGAGERDAEWRRAAAGVPGVVFTGWLSGGELTSLLTRSAIGLAAYAARAPQGVPNKVIEYLAAGLPILCSLDGESRYLLESTDSGLYFAAGDGAALAAGVELLMRDPQRRARMAGSARSLFDSRFAAASVYGEMANRLEIIARRPSAAAGAGVRGA